MTSLEGKNILITGASSGIGRAIASKISSSKPANVFLCGRDSQRLDDTAKSAGFLPEQSNVYTFIGDFNEPQSIPELVAYIKGKGIQLDNVVYSAGIDKVMPFKLASEKVFSELMQINAIIPLETTRQLLKGSLIREKASIVFLSSVMGLVGQPGQIGYSASKGAMIAAAKSLALELAPQRIRVNVIAAGIVQTSLTEKLFKSFTTEGIEQIRKMHPFGFGEPEDVANLVVFLFSDRSNWITGSTITIDGGYSAQ